MGIKQQLLEGVARVDEVHVPEFVTDDFDGTVPIRPLTDGEQDEVEGAMVAGQVVRGQAGKRPSETQIDAAKSQRGRRESRRIAAAYGMSVNGEKWKPQEVAKLPPAGVKRVAERVLEITGGENWEKKAGEEEAASFRGDTPGAGNGDPAPDGDTADDSAG